MQSSLPVFALSALLLLLALALNFLFPHPTPAPLLTQLAAHQFAWGASTTDIPISSVSVLAKGLLSRDPSLLPSLLSAVPAADTIPIQRVRDHTNAHRLARITAHCALHPSACDVSVADDRFGLTPLHLAAAAGDAALTAFLRARGAVPTPDHAGRLPANLSFAHFSPNSKRFARHAGRHDCDLPVVEYDGSPRARAEARRLVAEGEPALLRGALRHYMPTLAAWTAEAMVAAHGDMHVDVGAVPYAEAFNLTTTRMQLRDFYERYVVPASHAPLYVFSKGSGVCEAGYAALVRLVEEALPVPDLVAHPEETGGVAGAHFFFGKRGSGAPFHIHADAVNGAVHGAKRWFVFPPGETVYSRKAVKRWVDEDYGRMEEEDRPMECVQRAGDVVYVPLDWGHAVLNLDEETFGVALEVLNKRDTLSHLWQ